jgi:SAM-dependent methyltransferase
VSFDHGPAVSPRVEANLHAYDGSDDAYVDAVFALVLRRPPDADARERALARLGDGTLSRATLIHELATAEESGRVRELDDAVERGLGARRRGERLRWLSAAPGTDERVIEIPWVLSRVRPGRVLEVGYAFAEAPYLAGLLRAGVELVGVDLGPADVEGMETVEADVRSLPFANRSFDQVLLVSTLEHVGADNTVYGLEAEHDGGAGRLAALRELRRVLAPGGSLLLTVPLGEPGDHGWFEQDDVRGWNRLFAKAGFFVEEQEPYELHEDGWRAEPVFDPDGVRYGERGPGASAVLCSDLSPRRLRRLLTPGGLERTARRHARLVRHRRRKEQ